MPCLVPSRLPMSETRCLISALSALAFAAFLAAAPFAIAADPPRTDRYGDPLPEGAVARIGSARLRHGGLFIVDALAFSPDGKSLVSGDRDRGLCIWDVASGKRIRRFEGPKGWPFAAAFSADGTTVVCVGGGNAPKTIPESRVLDVASGKALKRFELRDATGAYEADVSPSGKLIALGRIENAVQTVRLYDPATGNEK